MSKFPALTLWQPWASLIAAGWKEFETRTWQPGKRLVAGKSILMIHAAKYNGREPRIWRQYIEWRMPEAVDDIEALWPDCDGYPLGAIVCACRFMGAHHVEVIRDDLYEQELMLGDYKDGRYAWELEVLKVPGKPIPAKGSQGIWYWECDADGIP